MVTWCSLMELPYICLCPCMSVSICVPVRKFPCPSTSLSVYVSVRLCPSLGPSLCPSMSVSLHVLILYILYVWSYSLIHYSWVLLMNAFEPNKFTALSATLAHSRSFSLILAHSRSFSLILAHPRSSSDLHMMLMSDTELCWVLLNECITMIAVFVNTVEN